MYPPQQLWSTPPLAAQISLFQPPSSRQGSFRGRTLHGEAPGFAGGEHAEGACQDHGGVQAGLCHGLKVEAQKKEPLGMFQGFEDS